LGFPHHRERLFIVGERASGAGQDDVGASDWFPFPARPNGGAAQRLQDHSSEKQLNEITTPGWTLPARTVPSSGIQHAIGHWEEFLEQLALATEYDFQSRMPSFPIWGFELDPWHWYPNSSGRNPGDLLDQEGTLAPRRKEEIEGFFRRAREFNALIDLAGYPPSGERSYLAHLGLDRDNERRWLESLPRYAIARRSWPTWKERFINQNREWALRLWTAVNPRWFRDWLDRLFCEVPAASHQKLEWNCKNEVLTLAGKILQVRPSGIRVKRFAHVPALVAMTTTQVPLLAQKESTALAVRMINVDEALQLQGFPPQWHLPRGRDAKYKALGNAVHCKVIERIAHSWFGADLQEPSQSNLGITADSP